MTGTNTTGRRGPRLPEAALDAVIITLCAEWRDTWARYSRADDDTSADEANLQASCLEHARWLEGELVSASPDTDEGAHALLMVAAEMLTARLTEPSAAKARGPALGLVCAVAAFLTHP